MSAAPGSDADCRLAVYGTLAPGEANHHQLAGCGGVWTRGFVRGHRAMREFPVFSVDPVGPMVPVQVLASDDLPAHWARLDAFEGDGYRRVLVPVVDAHDRVIATANLYEAKLPVTPS